MQDIILFIKKHFNEDLSLQALAEKVHFSSNYLSAQIKKRTGMTYVEYLMSLRLEEASRLLLNTDRKDIVYCGAAFFTRQILVKIYEDNIIEDTCSSVSSVVAANNKTLDTIMGSIETTAQLIVNSEFYYGIFSELPEYTVSDYLKNDRLITTELSKLFSMQNEVCDAYFYAPDWLLGEYSGEIHETVTAVKNAGWDKIAHEAKGLPVWISGYDYGKTIQSDFLLQKGNYSYRYLFTMVKEMNFQYSYMGSYYTLSEMEELPVLVVHVNENSIRDTYADSIGYENSLYAMCDENGVVVSSSAEDFVISEKLPENLFRYYGGTGYASIIYGDEEYLLCYDTLTERGFFSFTLIPMENLVQNAVSGMRKVQRVLVFCLFALSMMVAVVLSRHFSNPINVLVQASKRVGQGDFSANTPLPRQKEFRVLTESFNHMETRITQLIYENYEISLREKETQLMALSLQINPHFLYNTLNMINLVSLKNEDFETSEIIISLSEMLQYTVRNRSEKGTLEDEMAWISNYLYIMSHRYYNMFRTEMDIDETLMNAKIPKLILQPMLENSILHGFSGIDRMGIWQIKISRKGDSLCMVVYLTKNGMDPGEQLCTDDFAGHLSHNVNLSAKAILGVEGYALILKALGKQEGYAAYHGKAKAMADHWKKTADAGDHTCVNFGREDSWSLKYNLVWDRFFGSGLFGQEIFDRELAYYVKKNNEYGVPLDSRADYTKSDWILWCTSLTDCVTLRKKLMEPVANYLMNTTTRVPFGDWYDTKDGRYCHFIARSVQGGIFMPVFMDEKTNF